MKNKKIGFIGVGNMATAIITGLSNLNVKNENINLFDIDKSKTDFFVENNCVFCQNIDQLCNNSDIVFLSVKPQNFSDVLAEIQTEKERIFVSIAAGISIDYLKIHLGKSAKIARVMPNTPLLIGEGATAVSFSNEMDNLDKALILEIFSKIGVVAELPEEKMNEIIAVNASSPAFIYYLIDIFVSWAEANGISKDIAKELFCKTLIGSAKMALLSDLTPNELIDKVMSKGGTTFEMMKTFKNSNTNDIVTNALDACTKRAYELQKL